MNSRYLLPLLLLVQGLALCQTPTFTVAGVLNHASLKAGPIAPGELVAIMGSNLGDAASKTCAVGGVLPTVCSGVSVLLNNRACPVLFVWASQVIFQAPWDLRRSTANSLEVTREVGGQTLRSAVVNVAVEPIAPGLYTSSGNIGLFTTSTAIINASTPARPGETVTATGTGFGLTTPLAEDGKPPAGLLRVVAPVTAKVGDQDAPVTRAVLSPFVVGTVEVDFVVPQSALTGTHSVVITVGGLTTQSVLLPVAIPKPSISGVSNSASGASAIAGGSWVAIYGANLARTTRTWRNSDFNGRFLPTALDGVSVKINGKPAFVFFISPGQINVQAPEDTATGSVQVEVTNENGIATGTANLQTYSPAFFTFAGKYPAAVHLDGVYVAPANYFGAGVASRPAKPGDVILVFGTGFGPTAPAVSPGQIFSGAPPLANPDQLRISIGGVAATVQFAGIVVPGQYQFNVVVPAVPNGDQSIAAQMAGASSQNGLSLPIAH